MIRNHLPKKEKTEVVLIQGLIPKDVAEQVRKLKQENNWSWDEILTGLMKSLIEEVTGKRP